MTARRYAHTLAGATLVANRDDAEPACAGKSGIYDVLIDRTVGPEFELAVRKARDVCGGCPLMTKCLRDNHEEPWVRAVMGLPPVSLDPVVASAQGKITADSNRARSQQLAAKRLPEIKAVIANGGNVSSALKALNLSYDGLYNWCRRHGYLELWHALAAREPVRTRAERRGAA